MTHSTRRMAIPVVACCLLLSVSASVSAVPLLWTGGPGGVGTDWFKAENWAPPQAPTAADTLTINGPATTQALAAFTTDDTITATGGADLSFTRLAVGDTALGRLLISGVSLVHGPAWDLILDVGLRPGVSGEVRVTGDGVTPWPNSRLECLTVTLGGADGAGAGQPGGVGTLIFEQYGQGAFAALRFGVPAANAGSGHVEVTSGGSLWGGSDLAVDGFGGATSTLLVAGTNSWFGGDALVVGRDGRGEATVEDGGRLQVGRLRLGEQAAGDGAVVVSGAAAQFQIGDSAPSVGLSGKGSLTLRELAALTVDQIDVGVNPGGTGEVRVTGTGVSGSPNSRLECATLTLGGANGAGAGQPGGVGTLIIEQYGLGAMPAVQFGVPAANAGSGHVVVTSGGSLWGGSDLAVDGFGGATSTLRVAGTDSLCDVNSAMSALIVGRNGRGEATLEDGGALRVGNLRVGEQAAGDGAVVLSGPDALLHVGYDVASVGLSGNGSLALRERALLTADDVNVIDVGVNLGGTGEVRVTGTGAPDSPNSRLEGITLTLGGANGAGPGHWGGTGTLIFEQYGQGSVLALQFGGPAANAGSGHLAVTTGGSLGVLSDLVVDGFGGATSTLRVAGTDSLCNVNGSTGTLVIGREGRGEATLEDGGALQVGRLDLGEQTTGDGAMTISGPNAQFLVSYGIAVGLSGNGLLTIRDLEDITIPQIDVGVNSGGTGEVRVVGTGAAGWPDTRLECPMLTLGGANGAEPGSWGGTGTLVFEQHGLGSVVTLQFGAPAANSGNGHIEITTRGSLWVGSDVAVDGFGGETSPWGKRAGAPSRWTAAGRSGAAISPSEARRAGSAWWTSVAARWPR